jgi:predicted nucleic acid-binding protein
MCRLRNCRDTVATIARRETIGRRAQIRHATGSEEEYPEGMSGALVYVETSIPSFYHTTRTGPAAIAQREWPRQWWAVARARYSLVTSDPVLDELRRGDYPSKMAALELAQDLQLLEMAPPIAEIVEAYIQHRLMPKDPAGDALHLAIASYHKCEFLVTWNCQHLEERQQIRAYSPGEQLAGLVRAGVGDTHGAAR